MVHLVLRYDELGRAWQNTEHSMKRLIMNGVFERNFFDPFHKYCDGVDAASDPVVCSALPVETLQAPGNWELQP